MPKYLLGIVILCGLTLFVARQDERATQESAQKAAQLRNGAVSAKPNEQHPQENVEDTAWHTPGWYGFFRWPTGTTTCAIILTLLAIAEQTAQTAKAARETEKSAKAAADNIILTHRPRLVIRGIGLVPGKYVDGKSGTTVQDDVQWQIKYIVANIGGTDAHITDSNLTTTNINVVDGELFPEFPPYDERQDSMGVFTVKPGEHQGRMVVLDEPDTARLRSLRQMVQGGSLHTSGTAYLLGFIQYRDDAGVSRRTAFFRHYDAQTERFRWDKYPEKPEGYEYAD